MNDNQLSLFLLKKLVISHRSSSLIRRISLLSFIGIFISITLFFIVLFIMNGMNKNIEDRILALDPHLSITLDQAYLKNQKKSFIDLSAEVEHEMQSSLVMNNSIEFISFDLILRTIDGQFRGVHSLGYSSKGFSYWLQRLKQIKLKNQKTEFNEFEEYSSQFELKEGEVAIGIDLARSMGLLEGDTVTLIPAESLLLSSLETPLFERVTIRKIITTDLPDIDSKILFFNYQNSLKSFFNSPTQVKGLHIWLEKINKMNEGKTILEKKSLGQIETWKEKNSALFLALFLEKLMIGIFLTLAGLISSTSILTVIALIMTQKKMDIALIKTLGLSNRKALKIFLRMGLWISATAITLGTAIGVSFSFYLEKFPLNILPQVYYDSSIPAHVNWLFVLIVYFSALVLAWIGCWIPARAALKISPAILLKR